jgi:inner membrane protein
MPTIISHAAVAVALIAVFPERTVSRRAIELGIAVSIAPDIDVIGSRFGIEYGDLLGHRGLTHSLMFAALFASAALPSVPRQIDSSIHRWWAWLYFFIAAASHGVLDAFTDGGLGVAFFSPFDTSRYFFPVTPISVSPIGVSFFSVRGLSVLLNEILWLWLPAIAFVVVALLVRKTFHGSNFPHNYWRGVRALFTRRSAEE